MSEYDNKPIEALRKQKSIEVLRNQAILDLNTRLDSLPPKKQRLLAYWLIDYARFLGKENDFDPRKLVSYKRGCVVKANLGYRIGSEEGGLHYAIVVENNARSSPILTIVPLTSVKEDTDLSALHRSRVYLGDEIYKSLYEKLQSTQEEALATRDSLVKSLDQFENNTPSNSDPVSGITGSARRILMESIRDSTKKLEKNITNIDKMTHEISKMKRGSIALVGQITTLSKLRIYDPLYPNDVLARIRVSDESMNKLDDKIRELFLKPSV